MANVDHNLSLVVKAVDKATGPLRSLNMKMGKITAPLQNSMKGLKSEFGEDKWLGSLFGGLKGVGSAVGKVGHELGSLAAKFTGLAIGGGFALFSVIHGAVEAGDKLNEMSKRVGMGVDAYASLQFAAAQADVDAELFNGSMDKFNVRLGQLRQNTGPLKELPAVFQAQLKGAKDSGAAFDIVVRAMKRMKTASDKAALARVFFDKSGKFGQFLADGAEIDKQRKKFLDLSGSQVELADGADKLDNAMRETETAFLGLRNAAAAQLFPALTELAKALGGMLAGNRAGLAKWAKEVGDALLTWIRGGGLMRLSTGIKDLGSNIGTFLKVVGFGDGLRGAMISIAAIMGGPLILSVANLGIALAALAPAVLPFAVAAAPFILALGAVAAAIYQVHKNWDELKASGWEDVKAWLRVPGRETDEEAMHRVNGHNEGSGKAFRTFGPALPPPSTQVSAVRSTNDSRVTVDFSNMPPWAKATQDKGPGMSPVNLSVGYSMVTP